MQILPVTLVLIFIIIQILGRRSAFHDEVGTLAVFQSLLDVHLEKVGTNPQIVVNTIYIRHNNLSSHPLKMTSQRLEMSFLEWVPI